MEQELQTQIDEHLHFAKNYLKENLERNILRVTYIKVDGTQKVMDCTLQPEYTANYIRKQPDRKENSEVIAVWSLGDNDWRSLKVINIIEIGVIKKYQIVNTEGPDVEASYGTQIPFNPRDKEDY